MKPFKNFDKTEKQITYSYIGVTVFCFLAVFLPVNDEARKALLGIGLFMLVMTIIVIVLFTSTPFLRSLLRKKEKWEK